MNIETPKRSTFAADHEPATHKAGGHDAVAEGSDAAFEAGHMQFRQNRRKRSLFLRIIDAVRRAFFSSLTRRIVFLNLVALGILLTAILYLNQFREGLIQARVQSLLIQGRIIAGAIASSAQVETDSIMIDPEKLLEMQAGQSVVPQADTLESLESPIEPERVAPVLRTLIQPTGTRARIYDRQGILLLDSRFLYSAGQVVRFDLPALDTEEPGMITRIGRFLTRVLQRRDLEIETDTGEPKREIGQAMAGSPISVVRMSPQGEQIVSVAVPIQRFRAVLGVLLLSTQGGDIDRIIAEERLAILRIFMVAAAVMVILSVYLARTVANPLRKLAEAAVRVRHGVKNRVPIPDYSYRQDEIGNLSQSLTEMTDSLYARIEAIESFAADVSHELKNPLTSLRSAVETLPLARNDESRAKLLKIIQHDVRRLDRLITDISDASRLDAELAREDLHTVDLRQMLENIVAMREAVKPGGKPVTLKLTVGAGRKDSFRLSGHESRLAQVFANLLDNAASFVPEQGGHIDIALRHRDNRIAVVVEDNGPGVRAERIDRIFERFYTDRPEEGFGQNSGLGLSISKQIVEAHGGRISVENRKPPQTGARFTVLLHPLEGAA